MSISWSSLGEIEVTDLYAIASGWSCCRTLRQLPTSPASQWKSEVRRWKLGVAIAPSRLEPLNRPFEPLNQPTDGERSDFGNGSEPRFRTLN
ncbi:hypothetical protein PQG02_09440 [Nostoc sp. UHCC 0926]|uniref:hypothetical protein n=1 Tax=unclassified Nostoc TaxID=2593658 RepID=UPI00235F5260|nr:hypothetical protein [Nostoc sp. UHCC 0926]WDD34522.1 hypothetical protein PQG02_09440 [Nostoc sp. UHCC 0926]